MANDFSYLALALSLPVGIALFLVLRPVTAAIVVFLSFVMFLPEVVTLDAPGIPGVGKIEAASVACLFGMLLTGRRRLREARPFRGPEALTLLLFACDVATVVTNGDPVVVGPTFIAGLGSSDVVSSIYKDLLWYTVPFLVGRALITSSKELKELLAAVAIAGAIYTPLLFIELMLSPQLHGWIYGFYQHSFAQTFRGGGFRPTVFMNHGLAVGLFMAWAVVAAVALAKARRAASGIPAPVVAVYNGAFLVACKSLGAVLYAAAATPLLALLPPRLVARSTVVAALLVLSYPACRTFELFPVEAVVSAARSFSPARAESLEFRLRMEELITKHTAERPWFGWGWSGRNIVYEAESGKQASVSDGQWIVVTSVHGIAGFAATFPLLVWPLFGLRRRLRRIEIPADRAMLAGLAVMVAIGAVDLIPNGLFSHLIVFFAGALYGAAGGMAREAEAG